MGFIDLGGFVTRISFIQRIDASFLKSLPHKVNANNFHDADGHFIQYLISKNASSAKIEEYMYMHE